MFRNARHLPTIQSKPDPSHVVFHVQGFLRRSKVGSHHVGALSVVSDQGPAFAAAKKVDPSVLLGSGRVACAPLCSTLTRQVHSPPIWPRTAWRGLPVSSRPVSGQRETTRRQLKARLAKAVVTSQENRHQKIDAAAVARSTFSARARSQGHDESDDYLSDPARAADVYFATIPHAYFDPAHCAPSSASRTRALAQSPMK